MKKQEKIFLLLNFKSPFIKLLSTCLYNLKLHFVDALGLYSATNCTGNLFSFNHCTETQVVGLAHFDGCSTNQGVRRMLALMDQRVSHHKPSAGDENSHWLVHNNKDFISI